MNETEEVHRTLRKPVLKRVREEKNNTKKMKTLEKYKKIINAGLNLRVELSLRR